MDSPSSNTIWLAVIGGGLSVFWIVLVLLVRSWTNEAKAAAEKAQDAVKAVGEEIRDTMKILFAKLDKVIDREADCRASLAGTYATKTELREVDKKTDRNSEDIAGINARLDERKKAAA